MHCLVGVINGFSGSMEVSEHVSAEVYEWKEPKYLTIAVINADISGAVMRQPNNAVHHLDKTVGALSCSLLHFANESWNSNIIILHRHAAIVNNYNHNTICAIYAIYIILFLVDQLPARECLFLMLLTQSTVLDSSVLDNYSSIFAQFNREQLENLLIYDHLGSWLLPLATWW